MDLQARLDQLGLKLPPPPFALAAYIPAVEAGGWVFVSGQLPLQGGRLIATGLVGSEYKGEPCDPGQVTIDQAKVAARCCALNALAAIDHLLDSQWYRLARIVRLGVFVASEPGFTGQSQVADGASDLLVEIFGESGRHSRVAVGVNVLPKDAPVELELQAALRP